MQRLTQAYFLILAIAAGAVLVGIVYFRAGRPAFEADGVLGTEGGFDLSYIKADDHGSIDDRNRSCHISQPLKLFDCLGVLGYVSFLKRDLFLRKILFRPLAEHSARLREYRHALHRLVPS
jgi:hypothetical protein